MVKNNTHRTGSRVSKTVKKILSLLQIEHLDYFSKTHKKDVASNRQFLGMIMGAPQVARLSNKQVMEVMKLCGFDDLTLGTDIPFADLPQTNEFVENIVWHEAQFISMRGKQWIKKVQNLQETLSVYLERGYGNKHKKRVKGDDEYSEPLHVIFARTPPWLARVLSEAEPGDERLVKKAAIEVAKAFERQTGYKVHAVNIHREVAHDLHIHIVFSNVVTLPVPVSKRNRAKQVAELKKKVKAKLERKKLKDPSVKLDKTSIKAEYERLHMNHFVNEYTGEFRNLKVLKNTAEDDGEWPIERRSMATLGTAYRNKAWIWSSATDPDDRRKIQTFRDDSLIDGNFTNRVAKVADLEGRYLDWWLEQELFRQLMDGLSTTRKNEVKTGGEEAVANYIKYGKSVVHPMQQASLLHQVELDKKMDKSRERLAKWKAQALERLEAREREIDKRDAELEEIQFRNEIDTVYNHIMGEKLEVDREEVTKKFEEIAEKEAKLAQQKKVSDAILGREKVLAKKEKAISDKEKTITDREKDLRKSERDSVLGQVEAIVSPVLPEKEDTLKKVSKIAAMASTWLRVEPLIDKLFETAKKLTEPIGWVTKMVKDFQQAMGASSTPSQVKKKDEDKPQGPGN